MTTFDVRLNILINVRDALYELVECPPKMRNDQFVTDLSKVQEKLEGISVFWDAYIKATGIKTDPRPAIRNMTGQERDKYLLCQWWITMLNATIATTKVRD